MAVVSKTDSDSPTIKSTFKLSQVIIEGLSEEQYVAASSTALSSLVLAGAGTGKTRTLIGRLAYLFQQEESQTSNILMLAFARKAAVEMRERIDDLLPMISEGVQVNTFHSLGLYIVAKVKGNVPQLTELSEAGAMEHFIRHGFFELCAKDANYLTAYYKWLSIASITPSNNQLFRSLHDEYVDNRAELICANLLYQFRVDYLYKTHYAKPHTWERYKSYQPGFYLPAQDIYLEVYDVSAASLSEQQVERRQKSSDIHAAHKTKCIELFLDGDLEHFYQQIYALLSDFSSRKSTKSKHISLGRSAYHYESLVEQLVRWLPLFKYELSWPDLESSLGLEGKLLSALLEPLWRLYQKQLERSGSIDFEKMIILATEYIRSGKFQIPWDEVMIDEFQDISHHRAALIQAMREQRPTIRLFCVGDDWQAIYRFAGSDLRFTTEFELFFGEVQRYTLSQSFRFGETLSKESSRFVLANSRQSRKFLHGYQGHKNPLILCPLGQHKRRNWLVSILEVIQRDAESGTGSSLQERVSVLILSRFHHFLLSPRELSAYAQSFSKLELLQGTVHSVKGNEADYVLLLEMNRGEFGFPSEKFSDKLVESFLPMAEDFPFAEERRLFYVALTRAKRQIYLSYSEAQQSSFIDELKEGYTIQYLNDLVQKQQLASPPKRKFWARLKFFKFR